MRGTTTSGAGETVAVVDTGVELDQADLQGAIATNPGEIGTDARATTARPTASTTTTTAYVDDWRGWDFVDSDNTPQDLNGHGTHVPAIIAARRDNGHRHRRRRAAGARCCRCACSMRQARAHRERRQRARLRRRAGNQDRQREPRFHRLLEGRRGRDLPSHPKTLYVVAAGNGGSDSIGDNDDASGFWPCVLPSPTSCASARPTRPTARHRSRTSVARASTCSRPASASPRRGSTTPPPATAEYVYASGTSMATPMVSATVALMHAANPALGALDLRSRLLSSVDKRSALTGKAATGGRLDAATAVAVCGDRPRHRQRRVHRQLRQLPAGPQRRAGRRRPRRHRRRVRPRPRRRRLRQQRRRVPRQPVRARRRRRRRRRRQRRQLRRRGKPGAVRRRPRRYRRRLRPDPHRCGDNRARHHVGRARLEWRLSP